MSPTALVEGTDSGDEQEDEGGWVHSPTRDYCPRSLTYPQLDSPGWSHKDIVFEEVNTHCRTRNEANKKDVT